MILYLRQAPDLPHVTMRRLTLALFSFAFGCGPTGSGYMQTETATAYTEATSEEQTTSLVTTTAVMSTSLGTTTTEPNLSSDTNEPVTSSSSDSSPPLDSGTTDDNCDPFAQDCAEGEKCVPWGRGGFYGAKCVEVTGDKAPGEVCTAPEGQSGGIDDCALGSICFYTDLEGKGTCVEQCAGSAANPICPQDHLCSIAAEQYLAICVRTCDPLLVADCPESMACHPSNEAFFCVEGAWDPNQKTNDPCEAQGTCDKGLACVASDASDACDPLFSGCCQPYCKLPDGVCPNPDQQCRLWYGPPFYDPDFEPPAGYEHVGVCSGSE